MKQEPLLDVEFVFTKIKDLIIKLAAPLVFTALGIILIANSESFRGGAYLAAFGGGALLSVTGVVWAVIVISASMKSSGNVVKNTKKVLKNPKHLRFYWGYAAAAVLGLVVAVITGKDEYLGIIGAIYILLVLAIERLRKK